MMEYKVVHYQNEYLSTAILRLEAQVKKLQKEGWRCQGGVAISFPSTHCAHVTQAMVKEQRYD